MSSIVRSHGMYRSIGRKAIRQWSAGAVDACTRGGRSRLAVRASPVEMYRVSQASPDITKRGQEPTEHQNLQLLLALRVFLAL